jgi:hypothetical protein
MVSLKDIYQSWHSWSMHADKTEEGWQSDFPLWNDLIESAKNLMIRESISPDELQILALCWAISEESEELQEFAIKHIDKCWPTLEKLVFSELPACRWQVYTSLAYAGKKAEWLLREHGLTDDDSYCRRRAILALAHQGIDDVKELALQFIHDADPYIRQAAIEMVVATNDADFKKIAYKILIEDKVQHVKEAAIKRLGCS